MKELILLITLLGGNTHQVREKAQHDLTVSDYCFECILDHYPSKDPEIHFRLKEVLWAKYQLMYSEKFTRNSYVYGETEYVDFDLMKRSFEIDIRSKK